MQNLVASLEDAREILQTHLSPTSPKDAHDTIHHTTVQIDSVQSSVKGPRLVVVATGSLLILPQKDEVLIGRADPRGKVAPDIDLSRHGGGTAGVSRQHARLLRRDDNWMIEDLDSTNGTFVNEERVSPTQPTWLNSGDEVRCGHLLLTFHVDETNSI
jgi:pSer/pThr/pTyr-binding forkhead associated (FHA) protein